MGSLVYSKYDTSAQSVMDPNAAGTSNFPSPYVLSLLIIPMILQGSGSVAANGALTLTTALPSGNIYRAYMYFPAGAVYAGSLAGLYYVVLSNTTTGTIYDNVYTTGVPAVPSVLIPIVAAGPGAYTQTTGAAIQLMALQLKANTIDENHAILSSFSFFYTSSVNVKTMINKFLSGSGTLATFVPTTTGNRIDTHLLRLCAGVYDKITSTPSFVANGTSTYSNTVTCDATVEQTLVWTAQLAVASEQIILDQWTVQVIPSQLI